MASRSMGTLPMTLSLVASFMSAITLLGTPAEMYVSGMVQGGRGHWTVYYTSPQSFIIAFLIRWPNNFGDFY